MKLNTIEHNEKNTMEETSKNQNYMVNNQNNVELYSKTLREVFRIPPESTEGYAPLEHKLNIPDYQRIYCWEEKNVYKLLDDIFSITKVYHLGNIILQQKNGNYDIIDGQQRLVTLTLILAELGLDTQLLLQSFDDELANKYVAYNKSIIQNYIDKLNLNDKAKEVKRDFLLDKLLFSVLILQDTSLDLAYTFFSNQNSRGKSLSDYDLLKAHHLRFITNQEHAIHLAGRWDDYLLTADDENSDKDINRTLRIYLFRLRKWMRKKSWNDNEKFIVKAEFEADAVIPEIPPFGERFYFDEPIQGGPHFFAYVDFFVYKYRAFFATKAYISLQQLNGESHWWYRDIIEALLFAYYIKFSEAYLDEALVCITKIISYHRYENGRANYQKLLDYAGNTEIVMMIEQASSPTFFLAETVQTINKYPLLKDDQKKGIRGRYYELENKINKEVENQIKIQIINNLIQNKNGK